MGFLRGGGIMNMNYIESQMSPLITLVLVIILSLIIFLMFGFALKHIMKIIMRKKIPPSDTKFIKVPRSFIRKVGYVSELDCATAERGDVAYVVNENHAYFFTGESWVKIEQSYHKKDKPKEEEL